MRHVAGTREEGERLEDEGDGMPAQLVTLPFTQMRDVAARGQDRSRGWRVDATDHVEERRLAGAGAADDSNEGRRRDIETLPHAAP